MKHDDKDGPLMLDKLQLNSVYCDADGMYIAGANSGGKLHFSGQKINMAAELPPNAHNARPFRSGVLFNDTQAGVVRYCGRDNLKEDRALPIPSCADEHAGRHDANASAGNSGSRGWGLCMLSDRIVAGGTAPATVTLYDLAENQQLVSVALSKDLQQCIHSLAVWPFD